MSFFEYCYALVSCSWHLSKCFVCLTVDQRNLGMSMKIERSSLDQVKQRFERNKAKQLEEKKEYGESCHGPSSMPAILCTHIHLRLVKVFI